MSLRTNCVLGFVLIACAASGCGTVNNLTCEVDQKDPYGGKPADDTTRVFGGVRWDWNTLLATSFEGDCYVNYFILPVFLADFPLSLIGDALTLPYTVTHAYMHAVPSNSIGDQPPPGPGFNAGNPTNGPIQQAGVVTAMPAPAGPVRP
jgi:uncharacterized protein YceK